MTKAEVHIQISYLMEYIMYEYDESSSYYDELEHLDVVLKAYLEGRNPDTISGLDDIKAGIVSLELMVRKYWVYDLNDPEMKEMYERDCESLDILLDFLGVSEEEKLVA